MAHDEGLYICWALQPLASMRKCAGERSLCSMRSSAPECCLNLRLERTPADALLEMHHYSAVHGTGAEAGSCSVSLPPPCQRGCHRREDVQPHPGFEAVFGDVGALFVSCLDSALLL